MSRPLRIEYPDAWYHIMNRDGRIKENNSQELFGDLTPYETFIYLLKKAGEVFEIEKYSKVSSIPE